MAQIHEEKTTRWIESTDCKSVPEGFWPSMRARGVRGNVFLEITTAASRLVRTAAERLAFGLEQLHRTCVGTA